MKFDVVFLIVEAGARWFTITVFSVFLLEFIIKKNFIWAAVFAVMLVWGLIMLWFDIKDARARLISKEEMK